MLIIMYYLILCAVHMMQGFIYEKMLKGDYNYSQDRSFLKGNEENPVLVLSNVHKQNISQRWSHVRLYGPLHEYLLPGLNHRVHRVANAAFWRTSIMRIN